MTKLNATGSALVYSTYLGGSGGDMGDAIAVDATGSAYVTGDTEQTIDFPTTAGAFQTASVREDRDGFRDEAGRDRIRAVYSTYLGGGDR